MLEQIELIARNDFHPVPFLAPRGNIGRGFHFTRKGPGRKHNHTGTESQLKVMESRVQEIFRNLYNRWPTKVSKFFDRFGFCPVTVPVALP